MNGRIEVEEKLEKSIEQKVNEMPNFVSEWYYSLLARGVTIKSCRDYINKLDNFILLMNYDLKTMNVKDITSSDLTKYFSHIQYKINKDGEKIKTSDAYRNSVWFALNNFFEYHYNAGNIDKNYMPLVKPIKNKSNSKKERTLLTANDFKKMLCHIPGDNKIIKLRNKAILLLYMTTGMRRDALCQININDIDFSTNEILIIDKGEKEHIYNLETETVLAIKEWMRARQTFENSDSNALFITYQGNRMTGNSVYNMVTKCSIASFGKAISPHKLRSGLCSILYDQTHDIEFVRRAIGHSNIATTQRYIVTNGNEKAIASQIIGGLL